MRKRPLLLAGLLLVTLTGYGIYDQFVADKVIDTQELDNGAEIRTVKVQTLDGRSSTRKKIRYTWGTDEHTSHFYHSLRPALHWITENTRSDTKIAAWWDYGHSIQGYTDRKTVAYTPSVWANEHTMMGDNWNTDKQGAFTSEQTLRDLAAVFVGPPDEAKAVMHRYSADYLFVTRFEIGKFAAISQVYNKDTADFTALQDFQCTRENGRCRTVQRENRTYITYDMSGSKLTVPVTASDDTVRIQGNATLQQRGHTAEVVPCSQRVTMTDTGDALPGCVGMHPFQRPDRAVYVPDEALNATVVQLLFTESLDNSWEQVYADQVAQIWKPPKDTE